jgi:two-component system phosphate regulon response regulator PhoB
MVAVHDSPATASVLLVAANASYRAQLDAAMRDAGLRTRQAATGSAAVAACELDRPDVVVLDLDLPDLSGVEVCRMLRGRAGPAPLILAVGTLDRGDDLAALEAGADEHLARPASARELVLRIEALRRHVLARSARTPALEAGRIRLDPDALLAFVDGRQVDLTLLEFRLLEFLLLHPGKAHSRAALLAAVWSGRTAAGARTIDTHVKRLRRKLGDAGKAIETVRGVGYRLRVR